MPCPRPRLSMQHCPCWLSFSTATSVVSQLFPPRFFVEQSVPALREARVSAAVRSKASVAAGLVPVDFSRVVCSLVPDRLSPDTLRILTVLSRKLVAKLIELSWPK